MVKKIKSAALLPEIEVTTSKSGGPGGQSVNKVNTKVSLRIDIVHSSILNDDQKQLLVEKLASRISKDGILILSSDAKRSQLLNKQVAFNKLDKLLAKAFKVEKKRKKTKPSKAANQKRLDKKKQQGVKKQLRKKL